MTRRAWRATTCTAAAQVFCDLGTDCADCGPWKHRGPASGNASAAPIALLVSRGVEVLVARTKTVPSFIMPYTNPKHDVDVSGQMAANGHVELGITQACLVTGVSRFHDWGRPPYS